MFKKKKNRKSNLLIFSLVCLSTIFTVALINNFYHLFDMSSLDNSTNDTSKQEENLTLVDSFELSNQSSLGMLECFASDDTFYLSYEEHSSKELKMEWTLICNGRTYSDSYYFTLKDVRFTIGSSIVEIYDFECKYVYSYNSGDGEDNSYFYYSFNTETEDEELADELNISYFKVDIYTVD